jgi:peptide/nickel transport system permease protein
MLRYLAYRLPSAIFVLFLASVAVFALLRAVPGDPATALAGVDASPETLAEIRSELGLDKPVVSQYFDWIGSILTFDLGKSYVVGGEISDLIANGLTNTVALAVSALLVASIVALIVSVAAVLWDNPWLNSVLTAANTAAVAIPTFVTGFLFILIFAVLWPIFPAGGIPSEGLFKDFGETIKSLALPALCLAIPAAAALIRFLTESLRTQMEQPYVVTARALGISRRRIVLTQALRNALPPTVTILGIQVGYLLGGAVLVEVIFSWPGLGRLVENAISSRDYPVVQVLLLFSVAVFVVIQLVCDLIHALLDPRIRLGGES